MHILMCIYNGSAAALSLCVMLDCCACEAPGGHGRRAPVVRCRRHRCASMMAWWPSISSDTFAAAAWPVVASICRIDSSTCAAQPRHWERASAYPGAAGAVAPRMRQAAWALCSANINSSMRTKRVSLKAISSHCRRHAQSNLIVSDGTCMSAWQDADSVERL